MPGALTPRRILVAAILSVAGLVAVAFAWSLLRPPDWVLDQASTSLDGTIFRVDTNARAVALTFDDAPHPDVTPGIIRVLARHNARATFFVIGSNGAAWPALLDSIRVAGHELGNHFYTDRMSAQLDDEELREELLRTHRIIGNPEPPRWCRPGHGMITTRMTELFHEYEYTPVLGTAYPFDLRVPAGATVRHVLANLRPGAILVLHDGAPDRARTVDILGDLLPRIRARGYRLVTVSELVELGEREAH